MPRLEGDRRAVSDLAGRGRSPLLRRRELVTWSLLWVAVAALVVLPYAHTYRHLSPLDEMPHIDYLIKVRDGHLVRGGERMGQVALRAQACRGSDLDNYEGPRCAKHVRARDFPFGGFNTAYPDPPAYYLVTAAGATVIDAVPGSTTSSPQPAAWGCCGSGAG